MLPVLNPGGRKSAPNTPFSAGDAVSMKTDELLEMLNNKENFGRRKQPVLKALVLYTILCNRLFASPLLHVVFQA